MLRGMAGSAGAKVIFIWWQTAELSNHALLRAVSPISALSYQGRLGRPVVTMVTVPKICSYTLKGWDSSFSSMRITLPGTAVVLHEVLLSHDKKKNIYTEHVSVRPSQTYLDTYSLERVSMATGSLDSTTSRSNLESVWHCVSDSFRCFEGTEGGHKIRSVNVVLDKKETKQKNRINFLFFLWGNYRWYMTHRADINN